MAINESVTLPDAVATYIPLGGDGLSAPFALYQIDKTVAGDVSGGAITSNFVLDARYCSMIRWIGMAIGGVNADVEYRISIGAETKMAITGTLVGVASTVSSEGAAGYWVPPQTVLPPGQTVSTGFTNVDGDTFRISMEVLLWNIRVRELSPWPYLMNAAGGGGQASPGI